MKFISILLLLNTLVFIGGCASIQPSLDEDAGLDANNLLTVNNGPFDVTKIAENLDLSSYESIVINPVTIEYVPRFDEFKIPKEGLSKITSTFTEILTKTITDNNSLRVLASPEQNSLLLNIQITDVFVNVPEDIKRRIGDRVFTKEPVSMSIFGELLDSKTKETLVRFEDSEMPEKLMFQEMNRATVSSSFRQIMNRWSKLISNGLAEIKEPKEKI